MPEDTNTLMEGMERQWKEWHDQSAIERLVTPPPGYPTTYDLRTYPDPAKTLMPAPVRLPAKAFTPMYDTSSPAVVPCVTLPLNHARVILYITQHLTGGNATIIATAVGDNDTVLTGCLFCPASEVLGRELLEVEKVRNLAMQTAGLWQKQYGDVKRHT